MREDIGRTWFTTRILPTFLPLIKLKESHATAQVSAYGGIVSPNSLTPLYLRAMMLP